MVALTTKSVIVEMSLCCLVCKRNRLVGVCVREREINWCKREGEKERVRYSLHLLKIAVCEWYTISVC